MKKLLVLFLTILIMLSLPACSSGGSEELTPVKLGITRNQLIEQLGYSDEYYEEYHGELTYYDIELFDQYCKRARFMFENNELTSITIYYPSGADYDTIINALEKVYGEPEDFSTDDYYFFSYNNISINYAVMPDSSAITIYKSED